MKKRGRPKGGKNKKTPWDLYCETLLEPEKFTGKSGELVRRQRKSRAYKTYPLYPPEAAATNTNFVTRTGARLDYIEKAMPLDMQKAQAEITAAARRMRTQWLEKWLKNVDEVMAMRKARRSKRRGNQ
jgi:hypothetical protein